VDPGHHPQMSLSGPPTKSAQDPLGKYVATALLCLALFAVTLAIYLPSGDHTFFLLDGNDHVTENPHIANGLTATGVLWAFTSVAAFNWHPVTWLSHMAIAQFFGMDPRAHHLANVVVHAAASAALFLLLLRMTAARWQSFFVAALFALHPLHVESVAWVAERKDVLSALFCFLTLLYYSEYVRNELQPNRYALSLGCFILGLMSKSMLVTLPLILLLMDFWPLGRLRNDGQEPGLRGFLNLAAPLIKEKIPFFVCSLLTGVIAIYAQHRGGATKSLDAVPFLLRLENAVVSYASYLMKTLWPRGLGVFYPMPASFPLWQVIGSLLALLLISLAVFRARRRHPFLVVGWLWFIITLLPVIGLMQVGSQSMADRYTYLPSIGLFIMAAWGIPVLTKNLPHRDGVLATLAAVVIFASAALTSRQLSYWQDSVAIFRHTLQVTTGNYLVNDFIGVTLAKKGDLDAAIREFRVALQINPNDANIRRNLGFTLAEKGDLEAAIREYQTALQISPDDTAIRSLLEDALDQKRINDAAGK
jgi:protein O-mannosyl-transferase